MRNRICFISVLGIAFLLSGMISGFAQDSTAVTKKTPDLSFVIKRISDGAYLITSRVSWYENRKDHPVPSVPVDFSIGDQPLSQLHITATTDQDGYAEVKIDPGVKLPKDKEGRVHATASFAGTDLVDAASAEFGFIETRLSMSLELVDSVKTVKVKAYKIDALGKETPLEGESVTISVQRMLSRLPIGDVSIDAEGNGSLEFPGDLPGIDSLGNLEVIASITENESYGNIELKQNIAWGLPKVKILAGNRTLWSHIAPVWMIISLSIMLIGVWAHYLYVVIQLIRIKLKGKLEKA
jgi:hypothetical protein